MFFFIFCERIFINTVAKLEVLEDFDGMYVNYDQNKFKMFMRKLYNFTM